MQKYFVINFYKEVVGSLSFKYEDEKRIDLGSSLSNEGSSDYQGGTVGLSRYHSVIGAMQVKVDDWYKRNKNEKQW